MSRTGTVVGILLSSSGQPVGNVAIPDHVSPEFISLRGRVYQRARESHFDNSRAISAAMASGERAEALTTAWREVWVWEVEP